MSLDLIDELEQGVLSGVHAHGPHRPAQLFRADVSSSVNVKLIESLDKFHQKLNEERETGKPTEDRDGRSIGGICGNMEIWEYGRNVGEYGNIGGVWGGVTCLSSAICSSLSLCSPIARQMVESLGLI